MYHRMGFHRGCKYISKYWWLFSVQYRKHHQQQFIFIVVIILSSFTNNPNHAYSAHSYGIMEIDCSSTNRALHHNVFDVVFH